MKMPRTALGGLLFVSLALVGCGKEPGKVSSNDPKQGDQRQPNVETEKASSGSNATPQAVWEAMTAANTARDHKAFMAAFSPAFQKSETARAAYSGLGMRNRIGGSPKRDAEIKAENKPILDALDKHGLTAEATKGLKLNVGRDDDEKNIKTLAGMIKDPAPLWAELQAGFAKLPGYRDEPSRQFEGKRTDVKIDGDKATGLLVQMAGREEYKVRIVFIKVEGQWKIAPELSSPVEESVPPRLPKPKKG